MKLYQISILCKCFYLTAVFLTPSLSYASLNLRVSPTEGGDSIRLGRVDSFFSVDKEVRIRITSTGSDQYQVFQRLLEPLMNEQGQVINRPAIWASSLPGSNASGTVYLQQQESLGFSEQLIYTSAAGGMSDTISVIYRAQPENIPYSGTFAGKILYSARPIGSSGEQQEILNVFLEVSGEISVESEASSGFGLVRLDTERPGQEEGYLKLSIHNPTRSRLRIYQEILTFPHDDSGLTLSSDMLQFSVTSSVSGPGSSELLKNFQRGQVLIAESIADQDIVLVRFALNEEMFTQEKTGHFQGLLRYSIEGMNYQKSVDCALHVSISPVFKLNIVYPDEGLVFKNLVPGSLPQEREVAVSVISNLGKPYMVSQDVLSLMTNEKGEQLLGDAFTFRVAYERDARGRVLSANDTAVQAGDATLFFSDASGSPAEFRVFYKVRPSWDLPAGDFKTSIRFSLEEL